MVRVGSRLVLDVDPSGRDRMAVTIREARFSWWDFSATRGWMPACWPLSAVIFWWKWRVAEGPRGIELSFSKGPSCLQRIATDVSSLGHC